MTPSPKAARPMAAAQITVILDLILLLLNVFEAIERVLGISLTKD